MNLNRVLFPSKLRLDCVIGAAGLLLVAQCLCGTDLLLAELLFLFICLAGFAVNLFGGLGTLPGFCVAVLALKTVVISQIAKLVLGEPAQLRLERPVETAGVLVVGMAGICVAALLSRARHIRRPMLVPDNRPEFLRCAAALTFLLGSISVVGSTILGFGGEGSIRVGGLPGLLRQVAFSLGLSVVFSTAHVIVSSGGRRCLAWSNALPVLTLFAYGVLNANKEALFDPFLFFILTVVAFDFSFRAIHGLALVVIAVLSMCVFYPFAQMARSVTRGYDLADTIKETGSFIGKYSAGREGFGEFMDDYEDEEERPVGVSYFAGSAGILERLSLIKPVDLLVSATLNDGPSGWETVLHGFKMLTPRAINPRKPANGSGNFLGHKAGYLSEEDDSTQISFGFIADAFSAFGWWGAGLIPLALTLMFSTVYQFLVGPLARNVWCAFLFCVFQHQFTEQSIGGLTLMTFQQPLLFGALYLGLAVANRFLPGASGLPATTGRRWTLQRFPRGCAASSASAVLP